jgi:hypothetical protein
MREPISTASFACQGRAAGYIKLMDAHIAGTHLSSSGRGDQADPQAGTPHRPGGGSDAGAFDQYAAPEDRSLGGYAVLLGTFATLAAGFAAWLRRSGRPLPEGVGLGDLALITVASHKVSRLVAKDRVTSAVRAPFTRYEHDAGPGEVEEKPRGRGVRRAIGEMLVCPYCLVVWIAGFFTAGLIVVPRVTRWAATVMCAVFGSDVLHILYKRLQDTI